PAWPPRAWLRGSSRASVTSSCQSDCTCSSGVGRPMPLRPPAETSRSVLGYVGVDVEAVRRPLAGVLAAHGPVRVLVRLSIVGAAEAVEELEDRSDQDAVGRCSLGVAREVVELEEQQALDDLAVLTAEEAARPEVDVGDQVLERCEIVGLGIAVPQPGQPG